MVKKNVNWFEGYKQFTPSTNNALEATNRVIKDEDTLRNRLPLARFLTTVTVMIEKWGKWNSLGIVFALQPTISLETWTKA